MWHTRLMERKTEEKKKEYEVPQEISEHLSSIKVYIGVIVKHLKVYGNDKDIPLEKELGQVVTILVAIAHDQKISQVEKEKQEL